MESKSPPRDPAALLEVAHLAARYGKKPVLHDVSLRVGAGEIVSILGPNGAGKSTVLKAIGGVLPPHAGCVTFRGRDITGVAAALRVRLGIGYFMQGGQVFPSLTVVDNLKVGGLELAPAVQRTRVAEVFAMFPALEPRAADRAGLLSGGLRQALALGLVLMRRPMLLLLDEPSAGLAPPLVSEVLERIEAIRRSHGCAVLLVEQNVRAALKISARVYVLKRGAVFAHGTPEALGAGKGIESMFFG